MSKDESDTIFEALQDEMARSVSRLKLGSHDRPYFVEYKVFDSDTYQVNAGYGAISSADESKSRKLYSDIRVGDYNLDSSKSSNSLSSLLGIQVSTGGTSVTVEDDYDALRHEIWLSSDRAYKKAIESYEAKKAKLKAKPESERLPDMTKERPVVFIKPRVALSVDKEKWKKTVRDLSALFLKYPQIDNSVVNFSTSAGNAWLVNNEGFKHRDGRIQSMISILARVRSKDGRLYSDAEFIAAEEPDQLPDFKALEKSVQRLVARLERVSSAKVTKGFSGPVLFEPDASAALFYSVLSRTLGGAEESSGASLFSQQHPFQDKIGERVASRILNVVDDPHATEFAGEKLFGNYEVDDDGVPAKRLELIKKGTLETICASRQPTRGVDGSNGHSNNGTGSVSILFVSGEPSMSPKKMRKKLRELGKEQGYEQVFIVKDVVRLPTWLLSVSSAISSMFNSLGGGLTLYPTEMVRIDMESGKEELVRGPSIQIQPTRVLRDIVALGSDAKPTLMAHGHTSATSIVTPSVIIREVDLPEPSKQLSLPPILESPLRELSGSEKEKVKDKDKVQGKDKDKDRDKYKDKEERSARARDDKREGKKYSRRSGKSDRSGSKNKTTSEK